MNLALVGAILALAVTGIVATRATFINNECQQRECQPLDIYEYVTIVCVYN